ncbi:MAG: hypothetical protein LBQ48_00925, partial [Oscillospiraceae bacterium]|nr:hypothetical protein [Oscillospiraceae bacterium]
RLSLYSYAEFDLTGYSRYSDYNSYVHAEYDSDSNLIVCFNGAMERPHAWFNGFMASDLAPVAFDTSKAAFLGVYGSIFEPDGLKSEKLSGSKAGCEQMAGALQHDFDLQSGESVRLQVLIGVVDSMETGKQITKSLFCPGKIEADFSALTLAKQELSERVFIETPDEKLNALTNSWLKQQIQLCAEAGRDTGKGFRDQLQDAWASATFNPALAREKILETLTHMYADGRCVRGWLPLDSHIYSDGPVWIPPAVNAYIKETGDIGFLEHPVQYLDGGEDTVWEHILTAMRFASDDTGAHGLVHSRDGDWNDSLNMTGLEGRGESVWTSIALCYALQNTAEMADRLMGRSDIKAEMAEREARMKEAVNGAGWDGQWYLAAINDFGESVGSHTEKEGMIYLNSQTWAILAGVADADRREKCLDALDTYLDSAYGPLTLYPTYTSFNNRIGRLTGFVPGIWENGTPYCHGGTFKVVADCLCGRGDKAYETVLKILPDSKGNPSVYSGCEPYALTNMYFGPDNPRAGKTVFAWVTGTAGWMFRAITQHMLGFTPAYDGFTVNPCIPSNWEKAVLRRKFRGDTYIITIHNGSGAQSGVQRLEVDGKAMETLHIKLFGDGKPHTVDVYL